MSEPLVVQSLKEKRAEILGRIAAYEAQIAQARHDLAHINAAIRLFTEPEKQRARYRLGQTRHAPALPLAARARHHLRRR